MSGLPPLLILVSVAPMDPYPRVFAAGPAATWMRHNDSRVVVRTFSGLRLSPLRRQLSDLREMLRHTGAQLGDLGLVDDKAALLRVYGLVAAAARPVDGDATRIRRLAGRSAFRAILLASHGVSWWERRILSRHKTRRGYKVAQAGEHFTVHHPAALGNALAIQLALIKHVATGAPVAGVVFATSSAYVDVSRFVAWSREHQEGLVVGGSNALADRGDMGRPFISGFCQYFSWEAVQEIASASDFDHSRLNDEALTQWLIERSIPWVDPGIVWSTDVIEEGLCPLCADPAKTVVRCTRHFERAREAEFMRFLDHDHSPRG